MSTTGFETYASYLSRELSPDYWSDEGITIAQDMMSGFSDEDWIALTHSWSNHLERWRLRCAETLDVGFQKPALGILLAMLRDDSDDVVVAAADALRSWPKGVPLPKDIAMERILAMKQRGGAVVSAVLTTLLARASE